MGKIDRNRSGRFNVLLIPWLSLCYLTSINKNHFSKIAVYRDDNGKLYRRSAVCTHMGCIVRFNSTEKTWDCPCHGSRFGTDGHVINTPALKPLGTIEEDP